MLLEQAQQETDRIEVLRADIATAEICWLYRSKEVMIGHSQSPASDGRKYQRHLDVDEIQYQLDGKRTLITDRGALDLEPGDFVGYQLVWRSQASTTTRANTSRWFLDIRYRRLPLQTKSRDPSAATRWTRCETSEACSMTDMRAARVDKDTSIALKQVAVPTVGPMMS